MLITDYPHYERLIKDNTVIKEKKKTVNSQYWSGNPDDSDYYSIHLNHYSNKMGRVEEVKDKKTGKPFDTYIKGNLDPYVPTFLHLVHQGFLTLATGGSIFYNVNKSQYETLSTTQTQNIIETTLTRIAPIGYSITINQIRSVIKMFGDAGLCFGGTYFDFDFDKVINGYFNTAVDTRCKISESDNPEIIEASRHIDTLLASIGGERKENIDYLEQMLLFKHRNPSSTRLPLLMIIGEYGSNGKNLFCQDLCSTIFGGDYVSVPLKPDDLGKEFNSTLHKKLVWHFDEVDTTRKTEQFYSEIKRVIGSTAFNGRNLYQEAGKVLNTALPLMTSNLKTGPISLSLDKKSGIQRRFGVIRCADKNLIEIAGVKSNDDLQPLVNAINNPEIVGHWLWRLQQKHDISGMITLTAHQQFDFDVIVREQNTEIFEIVEQLRKINFNDTNYVWFSDLLTEDKNGKSLEKIIKGVESCCKSEGLKVEKISIRIEGKQKRAYAVMKQTSKPTVNISGVSGVSG